MRFVSFHFDAPYTFCDSRTFARIDATAAGRVEDASSDDADDEGCNAEANSEVDEIAAIDAQLWHMGIGVEAFDLDAMD